MLFCSHPFAVTKNRRSGYQNVGSSGNRQRSSFYIDAPGHLHFAPGLDLFDQLTDTPDLGQGRGEEMLLSEPGLTVMTNTYSTSCRISSSTVAGVAGLITTPACLPSALMRCTVRCKLALPSQ